MRHSIKTLSEAIEWNESLAGYILEKQVITCLEIANTENEDRKIAEELWNKYFKPDLDTCEHFKPLKFVYYKIIKSDNTYLLKRDLLLSPRAKEYFVQDDQLSDGIRQLVSMKYSITGKELKGLVSAFVESDFQYPSRETSVSDIPEMSYYNLSKQIAEYINTYFIECEKPIKDEIYYTVSCKEYGTATVYRDLNKSPRK